MQNIFGFIIHPMELGLIWLAIAVGSAGIGIILFTIFVRLVLADRPDEAAAVVRRLEQEHPQFQAGKRRPSPARTEKIERKR